MSIQKIALYGVSTLIVLVAALLMQNSPTASTVASVYLPLAFFTVVGLDFYRSQIKENGESEVAVYANAGTRCPGVCKDEYGYVRIPYFGERCTHDRNIAPASTDTRQFGFADRCLGYLFTSAFIFPAVVVERLTSRS